MNSIHDNQATIEKEKQEQKQREERAAEVTEATKTLTQNQTEPPPSPESETQTQEGMISKEDLLEKIADENEKLRERIAQMEKESAQGTNAQDYDTQS